MLEQQKKMPPRCIYKTRTSTSWPTSGFIKGVSFCLLLISSLLVVTSAYECTEKCEWSGRQVWPGHREDLCLIALPDNPMRVGQEIVPCQLDIHTNCTGFCAVYIEFDKFELPDCGFNVTNRQDTCEGLDSCEYVTLEETGVDAEGNPIEMITHFDGDLTSHTYVSLTDRIKLQFCYRSETFSARNIHLAFYAVDEEADKVFYAGPVSVYVLSVIVVLLAASICVIRWSPWLKPCLDPPPPPKSDSFMRA